VICGGGRSSADFTNLELVLTGVQTSPGFRVAPWVARVQEATTRSLASSR